MRRRPNIRAIRSVYAFVFGSTAKARVIRVGVSPPSTVGWVTSAVSCWRALTCRARKSCVGGTKVARSLTTVRTRGVWPRRA